MLNYSEDPKTIGLYPDELLEEDLTPDCSGYEAQCNEILEATKGWGTSEGRLISAIGNTTADDRMRIAKLYKDLYNTDLSKLMKSECGGDFGLALQYLSYSAVEAECEMLQKAMIGVGTNEKLLYSILGGRSNKDMELLKKTYYKRFTEDLVSQVSSELSGDLKTVMLACLQAAEEPFDDGFHTAEKAKEDAREIYKKGQGRWGTDEKNLIKVIVLSPPKHLKNISSFYADEYGYSLQKAAEKELSGDVKKAVLFILGIKLKPWKTIAALIKEACAGFGTDELLLTCTIIRYQKYLAAVEVAHVEEYGKSLVKRVKDETRGNYEKLLLALLRAGGVEN
jgi:hypothetical protein